MKKTKFSGPQGRANLKKRKNGARYRSKLDFAALLFFLTYLPVRRNDDAEKA